MDSIKRRLPTKPQAQYIKKRRATSLDQAFLGQNSLKLRRKVESDKTKKRATLLPNQNLPKFKREVRYQITKKKASLQD